MPSRWVLAQFLVLVLFLILALCLVLLLMMVMALVVMALVMTLVLIACKGSSRCAVAVLDRWPLHNDQAYTIADFHLGFGFGMGESEN